MYLSLHLSQSSATTSVPGFTNNCNNPSNVSHTWPACDTAQLFKFQSKENMKTNSQQSFLFRFKIQFKTVSTTYTVQVVSNDLQQYMLNSNTSTTAVQTNILGYLMHLRNQINVPKQANKAHSVTITTHSVVNQQSQHQVPLCLQCHDGSYLSLSLSTLVPTLPGKQQCFRLQSQGHQSVQTSVKLHCSCTLLNLRCSTIHALHYKCGN